MPRVIALALIAAHGLAVAALAVAVGWTHNKPQPCRKTFERVQVGMTREEVEATVGGPPGDYCSADWMSPRKFGHWLTGDAEWTRNADQLLVWYTDGGYVRKVFVGPSFYYRQSSRSERVWAWVTTGYDTLLFPWYGPYDLGMLRDILVP